MRDSSKKVLLGMLSGSLITIGLGLVLMSALFWWFLHHMFIDLQLLKALFVMLLPTLLIAAGVIFALRSLREPESPSNSRTVVGTILMLAPLFLLATLPLMGVLFGALGMDIHWNATPAAGYVALLCVVLILCLCFIVGARLRRKGRLPTCL